jgi:uncharacterized membrane protein YdjX (TVP38/TMEM64 family)
MKRHLKKIILAGILAAAIIGIRASGAGEYFTFENLQKNKEALHELVSGQYAFSVFIYIAVYIAVTAFSIPGATILTLAGGFLFGPLLAIIYVNAGANGGAVLAFLSARYLIGGWVQDKYGAQLKKFNEELSKNGHLYMLTLRFIPVFPFFLINIFAGLTNIPVRTFIWTTAVGIIPGSAAYAFAGSQINYIKSADDIFSARMLIALLLLGLFSIAPVIIKKLKP